MPADGDLDALIEAVAAERGRPIHVMSAALGADAPSGLWVSTSRRDYIVHPDDATPTRRTAIICHELAHMLLDHDPGQVAGDTATFLTHIAPDIPAAIRARFLARHGYEAELEADAEHVATRLTALCAQRRRDTTRNSAGSISAHLR